MADANPSGLGAFDLPLRLPGQTYDAETGLHYNYFREYDPIIGRYVAADPAGLIGGLNAYAYAHGVPLMLIDTLGLDPEFPSLDHPPSMLDLTTMQAVRRDTTLNEAISRGEGFRNLTGPLMIGATTFPYAGALATESSIAACRAVPEVAPKVAEACKNPLLAFLLGSAICGKMTGTVKDLPGEYARTRERLQEIRDASERVSRVNAARQISR